MAPVLDDVDLAAAWIRRAEADHRAFMGALAAKMEAALPGRVEVRRGRDGLLSRTSHVTELAIEGERARYRLAHAHGGLKATRVKAVRGVVISTAEIGLPEWLAEVRGEVEALAGRAEAASDALQGFL